MNLVETGYFLRVGLGVTSILKLSQITGKDRLGVGGGFYIRELCRDKMTLLKNFTVQNESY